MKLSIITVNRNNAEGLKKTIESVITQTYTDYEYIIIDGASTDGSVDIIKHYENKINYWISEPDTGVYNAMNKGILRARGDYINFMNSGDTFTSGILSEIHEQLDKDIICGNGLILFNNGSTKTHNSPSENDLSMSHFFKSNPFPHQACFVKRELFTVEMFNEGNKVYSDLEFFIKQIIFNNCSYKHINKIVTINEEYGISAATGTSNRIEREKILENCLLPRIKKDYESLNKYKEYPSFDYIVSKPNSYKFDRIILFLSKFYFSIYCFIKKK